MVVHWVCEKSVRTYTWKVRNLFTGPTKHIPQICTTHRPDMSAGCREGRDSQVFESSPISCQRLQHLSHLGASLLDMHLLNGRSTATHNNII